MAEYQDITKTGPVGLKGLRALSADEESFLNQASQVLPTMRYNAWVGNTGSLVSPAVSEPQHRAIDDPLASWGSSKYDTMVSGMQSDADALNEARYNNQSILDTMGNAIVKMLGTAATTLVSSIAGPIVGIPTAINERRWSGLWDNELTQALSDFDEQLEEDFKIYQSKEQQNAPWLSAANLTSASFWGDDVIRNAGFMLGAAASGSMFTGALGLAGRGLGMVGKAMNLINDIDKAHKIGKFGQAMLGSIFSAAGEGAIEAKNLYNDTVELETQRLDEELSKLNQAAVEKYERTKGSHIAWRSDTGYFDPAYQELLDTQAELRNRREIALQQIQERARSAGNWDMLLNMPILIGSNMITLGKGFSKSYRNAAKMAESETRATGADFIKGARDIKSKAKGAFTQARKSPTEEIKDAINYGVKGIKHRGLRTVGAAVKPFVAEGSEEMNQAWASATAGDWKMADDVSEYWEAKKDNKFSQDALSFVTALGQGFLESWGSFDQWEQLFVGGLTGAVGMPMPTKIFGRSEEDNKKKKYNPSRYFSWEGGSFSSVKEFKDKLNSATQATENLNNRMKNPDFWNRLEAMTAHAKYQEDMENSVANESIKDYKDAEEKQFVQDLEAFVKAGKLDDFRTLINAATQDLSNDDITQLINRQKIVITADKDADNKRRRIQEEINGLSELISNPTTSPGLSISATARVDELNEQLKRVVGEEKVISPYMDANGNLTKPIEEIRAELQRNGETLNKRIDSYMKSIGYVNRITKGNLTSDQEGTLAYLHYMGSQANERANKIIERIKPYLPETVTLNSNKDADTLNKEYGTNAFYNDPETGKLTLSLSSVEDSKTLRPLLQYIALDRRNFSNTVDKIVATPNYTKESQETKDNITRDIGDLIRLGYDASRYYTTLQEYMTEPNRVEEKKKQAEKKNDNEVKKSNIDNKSVSDLAKSMDNGELADDDLPFDIDDINSFEDMLEEDPEDSEDPNETEEEKQDKDRKTKVAKAKNIVETKGRALDKAAEIADPTQLATIEKMLNASMEDAEDVADLLDMDKEAFNDPELVTLNNEAVATLQGMEDVDIEEEIGNLKKEELDEIKSIMELVKEDLDREDNTLSKLPKAKPILSITADDVDLGEEVKSKDPISSTKAVNSTKTPTKKEIKQESQEDKKEEVKKIEDNMENTKTPDTFNRNILSQSSLEPNNSADVKGYWKNNTTEYSKNRDPKGNKPYHEYVQDPKKKAIYKTIHTFLSDKGAFARINNNEVTRGEKVRFAISKELSGKLLKETGEEIPVLLIIDENNNILADLTNPKDTSIFDSYKGLRELYARGIEYYNEHHNDNTDDLVIIPDVESTVARNFIGRPLYTPVDEIHNLNTISQGKPFKLGIAMTASPNVRMIMTPNRSRKDGQSEEDSSILSPLTAESGQPFLLIETSDPRRKWYPIPICMPQFNSNSNPEVRTSQLYRKILEHFVKLTDIYTEATPSNKFNEIKFLTWKDGLLNLVAIPEIYIGVTTNKTNGAKELVFRIKHRRSDTSWDTLFKAPFSASNLRELVDKIEALNFPFQISRKYINSTYDNIPYNELIGELAFTNLKIGALHTVNDFFTINPIVDNKETRAKGPKGLSEQELTSKKQDKISSQEPTSSTFAEDTSDKSAKPTKDELIATLNNTKLFNTKARQDILNRLSEEILGRMTGLKKMILKNRADSFFSKVKPNMTDEQLNELAEKSFDIKQNREIAYDDIGYRESQQNDREAIIKRELKVIRELLPQLSERDRIRIVDTLIKIPNGEAWGQFKDGIIALYRNAAPGTAYHEAFHFVFNSLMNDTEIEEAYESARGKWGNLDAIELEERMAEDFREYMQNRESLNVFKRLWAILKDFINKIRGNTLYLNRVYSDIAKGRFSDREIFNSPNERFSKVYTKEVLQERVDSYVNRANSTRVSRNNAWGKVQDSLSREGYKMKGHYDRTYGWRVDSVTPKDSYRTADEIKQYHYDKLKFGNLNKEQKDYLNERHISKDVYENMTLVEREVLFRCMY